MLILSLSVVKASAAYPERTPIGWDAFENAAKEVSPLPVYAVGGLNLSDKSEALRRGACGIMVVRYLYPDDWLKPIWKNGKGIARKNVC